MAERGGIFIDAAGRKLPVQITFADDRSSANLSGAVLQQLLGGGQSGQPGRPVACLRVYGSSPARQQALVARAAQRPFITGGAFSQSVTAHNSWSFATAPPVDDMGVVLVEYLTAL